MNCVNDDIDGRRRNRVFSSKTKRSTSLMLGVYELRVRRNSWI